MPPEFEDIRPERSRHRVGGIASPERISSHGHRAQTRLTVALLRWLSAIEHPVHQGISSSIADWRVHWLDRRRENVSLHMTATGGSGRSPNREENRDKTTSRATTEHSGSRKMPFALTSAPTTLQRTIDIILVLFKWQSSRQSGRIWIPWSIHECIQSYEVEDGWPNSKGKDGCIPTRGTRVSTKGVWDDRELQPLAHQLRRPGSCDRELKRTLHTQNSALLDTDKSMQWHEVAFLEYHRKRKLGNVRAFESRHLLAKMLGGHFVPAAQLYNE